MEETKRKKQPVELTAKYVERLKYKGIGKNGQPVQRDQYYDARVAGLALQITKTGKKSWVLYYRVNGKTIKQVLGRYSSKTLTLAKARELAGDIKDKAAEGIDSRPSKQNPEQAAPRAGRTFGDIAMVFYKNPPPKKKDKPALAPSTLKQYRGDLDRVFLPAWRDRPIADITRYDVDDVLTGIKNAGKTKAANSAYRTIRRLFSWAASRGHVTSNPCLNVDQPCGDVIRDRFLNDEEIKAVWQGCEALGYPFGPLFQLMMVLGRREGVTAKMKWQNLYLNKREWHIPKEDDKTKTPHVVPLPFLAVNILRNVPRFDSPYVFTKTLTTPVSGFSKAKNKLDKIIRDDLGFTMDPWRLHDLRRTVRTKLAELQVTPDIAKLCLGHNVQGIDAVYDRHSYIDERRIAIFKWTMELLTLIADEDFSRWPRQRL